MLHEPAAQAGTDHAAHYKMKLGVKMLIIYALVYVGFVGINVFKPTLMEATVLFGMNLAVVYGFGLIIFALVLALIYSAMCGKQERLLNAEEQKEEGAE